MSLALLRAGKFAILSAIFVQKVWSTTCETYGVDFHGGDSYFQNSLSADNFTFASSYDGCQNATAKNVLTLPDNNSVLCSNTDLQPDNTSEISTCGILKSQLVTGDYIIQIQSDNDGDTISRQRNIHLVVGPQQTSTYIPTVTVSATITPIINSTSTSTFVSTTTLDPSTVTSPSSVIQQTVTVTPTPVTSRTTIALATITQVHYSVSIIQVIQTSTATCITPVRQVTADPTNTDIAQLLLVLETSAPGVQARNVLNRRDPMGRREDVAKANRRSGYLNKRSPDSETITVTDLNTADYITTTTTSTAPPTTVPIVVVTTTTTTSTPSPVTEYAGISTAALVALTATPSTKTRTTYIIAQTTITSTRSKTVTVTTTTTPADALASCTAIGGIMD